MDEITFDLKDLALEDRVLISNLSVKDLVMHVKHQVDLEDAKSICFNAGLNVTESTQSELDDYLANKSDFADYLAKKDEKRAEKIEFITKNSQMSEDALAQMPDDTLDAIAKSVAPKQSYKVINGKRTETPKVELIDVDALPKQKQG